MIENFFSLTLSGSSSRDGAAKKNGKKGKEARRMEISVLLSMFCIKQSSNGAKESERKGERE